MAKIAEALDWANATAQRVAEMDAEMAADYAIVGQGPCCPSTGPAGFMPELLTPELVTRAGSPADTDERESHAPLLWGTAKGHKLHEQRMQELQGAFEEVAPRMLLAHLCEAKREAMRVNDVNEARVNKMRRFMRLAMTC